MSGTPNLGSMSSADTTSKQLHIKKERRTKEFRIRNIPSICDRTRPSVNSAQDSTLGSRGNVFTYERIRINAGVWIASAEDPYPFQQSGFLCNFAGRHCRG